jgi:spermidine synthase
MTRSRPAVDLFLVSGLILFLELACIRWFPAHVLFLSFFTNVVLLACFVGMSVGCVIARKPTRHLRTTPYWLAAALACGLLVETYHQKLERHLDVGNQANPDVVFFGAETSSLRPVEFAVPIEVIAGAFYFLVAASLVGPGQELGRAFNRLPNRAQAYSLNLLGSLAGIALFAGCSELSLPPVVWFAAIAIGIAYFLMRVEPEGEKGRRGEGEMKASFLSFSPLLPFSPSTYRRPLAALAVVVALSAVTSGLYNHAGLTVWSPYYRIRVNWADSIINTNLISHQVMSSRETGTTAGYSLPYLFARETGRAPYQRILIIGAGSGNDLSRALYWSPPNARIDAVEIDPAIRRIGGERHPDSPYSDPRVTTHLTDGRTFLRTAPSAEYDLVIFALVDSLVLHSSASNLRLESYLFTQESFADVARVLKPNGTAAVYNFFRHGWIVARLRDAMRTAFAADPVVLTDPPADHVALNTFNNAFTAVFAGREEAIAPLRAKFADSGNSFWIPGHRPVLNDTPCRFGPEPPGDDWVRLRAATVEESPNLPPATDVWPFLYARRPTIPAQTWRGVALVALLSVVVWWVFRDRARRATGRAGGVSPLILENGETAGDGIRGLTPPARQSDRGLAIRSFLLGAGFMLIETRAVVEMALLFGSTWVVNTVVFAAVLVMSLIGTRFAWRLKPRTLWPYYVGLFAALAVNLLVPAETFLGWPRLGQIVGSCLLTFAPIAFAGVIFAASFARSAAPDRVFAANVAGALVGGLVENASMLLGFRWLLLVAGGFYLLSGLVGGSAGVLSGQFRGYNSDEVWVSRVNRTRLGRWVRRVGGIS